MKKKTKHIVHVGITGILTIFVFGNLNAQNSLLWKVSGNGLKHPSYLFGTVHMYDTTDFTIPKAVFSCLEQCSIYAMEINTDDINQMAVSARMMITDGNTLDILLGEEAFGKLMSYPVPKMMGANAVKRIKPVFTTSFVYLDDISQQPQSIDTDLAKYAKSRYKQVVGIETIEEQLDAIDAIPIKEQADMLKEAILKTDDPKDAIKKLWSAYKSQDFTELEEELKESSSSPLFTDKLITQRNITMADRISDMIKANGSVFSAIGALHLVDIDDAKGVITLLQEKGYTLTPVEFIFTQK